MEPRHTEINTDRFIAMHGINYFRNKEKEHLIVMQTGVIKHSN